MAIYHLSIKTVARAAGRSATAAAAYRSGERIADRASGQIFDYTRKRGVEHTEIVLPTRAALEDINWARDRQALWNAAETAEKRKDARVAREYEVAIPHELDKGQRAELLREFSAYLANRYAVAVDFAIHKAHDKGDQRNHHAHVLTTTRDVTPVGLGAKTALELSETDRAQRGLPHSREEFIQIRERWAMFSNEHLKRHGHQVKIDHRTLAAQGIDRQPTTHLGVAVTGLIRRGIESHVQRRVAWQEQQAALQRLGAAKAAGVLQVERQRSDGALIWLNSDVRAARRERGTRKVIEVAPPMSREAWVAYRTHQDRARPKEHTPPGAVSILGRGTLLVVEPRAAIPRDCDRQGLER